MLHRQRFTFNLIQITFNPGIARLDEYLHVLAASSHLQVFAAGKNSVADKLPEVFGKLVSSIMTLIFPVNTIKKAVFFSHKIPPLFTARYSGCTSGR